jgi:hypothetical protein
LRLVHGLVVVICAHREHVLRTRSFVWSSPKREMCNGLENSESKKKIDDMIWFDSTKCQKTFHLQCLQGAPRERLGPTACMHPRARRLHTNFPVLPFFELQNGFSSYRGHFQVAVD